MLAALAGRPSSVRRRGLNRFLLRLPLAWRRRAQYALAHDRLLSLAAPERWTEKVNWRMVHDRRPLVAMTCDKLAAKAWVSERLGSDLVAVPRTVWSGDDPWGLADVDWPDSWVLKPNHGTGLVQLGRGRPEGDRLADLVARAGRWLAEPGPEIWGEWGYGLARRLVVVEEAVPGTPTTGRTDYKFFVTGGVVRLAYVDVGRFGDHRRQFVAPDGTPLGDTRPGDSPTALTPPRGWDAMVSVAAKLGAEFDAVRVDLYLEDGLPWFGELTAYDGGGLLAFPDPHLDTVLGATWELPVAPAPHRRPRRRVLPEVSHP